MVEMMIMTMKQVLNLGEETESNTGKAPSQI
jgi:hypothetical protein